MANEIYGKFEDRGLRFVFVVVEDAGYAAATPTYCGRQQRYYSLEMEMAADPGEVLKAFNDGATTNSLAIVVDEDGTILYRKKYGSRGEIEAKIEEALSN